MQELRLHAFGKNDHLEFLKKHYDSLKHKIKGNTQMNTFEKKSELEKLKKSFEKDKNVSKNNLY
ncbi:hypothetical protein ACKGJY_03620 [Hyunsoonleella sp. 2307UL5-6]|uniref:hypothetical protein n=1 Tax=Hyunsoonleella sp. 2307UL5-6 TaxID=3384768 RepID=UPI0039BC6A06